ncbi:hypothetical protein AB0B45_48140 [Nonomuraea sp. NPDC049152]|uniref:hypothetical protein n=1 Tax=Nonomuraea sp. NPDC049152 TaxID=3154350 RepID=UPI0033CD60F0
MRIHRLHQALTCKAALVLALSTTLTTITFGTAADAGVRTTAREPICILLEEDGGQRVGQRCARNLGGVTLHRVHAKFCSSGFNCDWYTGNWAPTPNGISYVSAIGKYWTGESWGEYYS